MADEQELSLDGWRIDAFDRKSEPVGHSRLSSDCTQTDAERLAEAFIGCDRVVRVLVTPSNGDPRWYGPKLKP